MPFMQRLAWTGVAMHEGAVHPGHTASHGCIRLQAAFAKELFGVTNAGQRVIISPVEVTPADIVHAHLPVPKLQETPALAAMEKAPAVKSGVETVALDSKAPAQAKPLNPLDFATAMKTASAAKVTAATAARKAAQALLDSKPVEVRQAARELDLAEDALKRARAELDDATGAAAKAEGEEAQKKAAERKSAAEAKLAAAEAKAAEAREAKAAKEQALAAAQNAIRDADAATAQAASRSQAGHAAHGAPVHFHQPQDRPAFTSGRRPSTCSKRPSPSGIPGSRWARTSLLQRRPETMAPRCTGSASRRLPPPRFTSGITPAGAGIPCLPRRPADPARHFPGDRVRRARPR